ncbi:MAG: hypothetical protein Q8K37_05155 [Alphaproteobacteria bacterium]|nr:hypothetical protein [Alphaproteobacteria bacterium]
MIENEQEIFKKYLSFKKEESNQVEKLQATIGRLKIENDFLAKLAYFLSEKKLHPYLQKDS